MKIKYDIVDKRKEITMLKRSLLALLCVTFFLPLSVSAEMIIVRQATVREIIMPAGNSQTAVVSFDVIDTSSASSFDLDCVSGFGRVKFPKSDKQILSLLMYAHALNLNVGFYYNPNGDILGEIEGHGTGTCELINVWIW